MNKALKGKAWTIVGFFIIFLIIVGIIALVRYFTPDTQFIESRDALVEGEYSVDGGEWKEFYGSESIWIWICRTLPGIPWGSVIPVICMIMIQRPS